MAKHIRGNVANKIILALEEKDGLSSSELSARVSEQGEALSRAAFFRALKELKEKGIVIGISEGGRTINHLQRHINFSNNQEIRPYLSDTTSHRQLKLQYVPISDLKAVINSSALDIINSMINEYVYYTEDNKKIVFDKAILLYNLVETYEESTGKTYKRPWKKVERLECTPESEWIKFFGYVVGDVYQETEATAD